MSASSLAESFPVAAVREREWTLATFRASFEYSRSNANTLVLDGTLDGKKLHATLRRAPDPKFLLNTRGFHWVNEYPFHR